MENARRRCDVDGGAARALRSARTGRYVRDDRDRCAPGGRRRTGSAKLLSGVRGVAKPKFRRSAVVQEQENDGRDGNTSAGGVDRPGRRTVPVQSGVFERMTPKRSSSSSFNHYAEFSVRIQ